MMNNNELDYIVRIKKENLEIKPTLNKTLIYKIILCIIFLLSTIFALIIFSKIRTIEIEQGFSGDSSLTYMRLSMLIIPILFIYIILELNDRWNLKIENGILSVKQLFKRYKVNLQNLINIEMKTHMSRKRSIISHYISIIYIKDNKIKVKKLQFKSIKPGSIINTEQYISDEDMIKIDGYFITKKQLEQNPLLEKDSNYIEIRNSMENSNLEKILEDRKIKGEKIDKICMFFLWFIITILAMFIFKMVIEN